ncbi:major facilitator superfamily domain-containing protein [Aspergillus pseudoustus]|uniref:Major facilitator superfamily domain-containing protein n=1 Tax=Aspergillus pseudoustus TaxID=1810923 RepID=A0ABR4JER1_9EURO
MEEDITKAKAIHEEAISTLVGLSDEEKAIERRVVRRVDMLILPLVVLVYLMNYIDRNNYSAARLQGLESDLNLVGEQYQTGLSIFFVSYILGQLPSNLMLNYFGRPSLYLGLFVCAWGSVAACTAAVQSYGGIMACRFILGIVESPFFSGVLFYLSKWYTRSEINLRMAIFYSGGLLSGAFGNLIAAGILNGLAGRYGLAAWRWLYIIEGGITVFVGLLVVLFLPDFPHTWRLLSPEEKNVAIRRLALEATESDIDDAKGKSQLHGLQLAVTDIKTWILAAGYTALTGAAGFQNFFPTLTATLGYSHTISLLLVAPPYIFMTLWSYGHGWLADKYNQRFWFYMYPIPLTIIGFVVFMTTDSFGPRYFSFFLVIFVFATNVTTFTWIASSIGQPPAKRAAAFAIINALGTSTSIWTPYTYTLSGTPYYRLAFGICLGLQVVTGLMGLALRWVLVRENQRLARLEESDEAELSEADMERLEKAARDQGVDVQTARVLQRGFRYVI